MSKKYWNVLIIFILTISIIAASSLVYSQEKEVSNQEKSELTISEDEDAEVKLGDSELFKIINSAGDLSPQARADQISDELKKIADSPAITVDNLYIEPQNQNSIIVLKLRKSLVTLTEEDARSEEKGTTKELAEVYKEKIKNTVNKYREKNRARKWFAPWLTLLIFFILLLMIVLPFFVSRIKTVISNSREWFASTWAWITRPFKSREESSATIEEKYRVGEPDNTGKLIEYIYQVTRNYIIYRTNKVVRWLFDDKLSTEERKEYEQRINKIMNNLAIIEFKNPKEIERVETINRLTAKGIGLALEDDNEGATKILEQAEDRIECFRKIDTKLQYLISSLYTVIIIILTIIIFVSLPAPAFFSPSIIDIVQEFHISELFLIAISCGALGGFLSVASGINRISIDPDSDVMIAGMSRIYIAVISSVIIYIALRANLLGDDLSQFLLGSTTLEGCPFPPPNPWRVGLISAAAGFTEYLVPNILKNLSNQSNQQQKSGSEANQNEGGNEN